MPQPPGQFRSAWSRCAWLLAGLLPGLGLGDEELPRFRDPAQPVEERVQDLLGRLTLEEKAQLLDHRGPTLQRFGLRADQWNQCLNGVKWDRPTTLFPICLAMAATWDTSLVHEVATALSDEARAIYNGWHRDPQAPGEHKGLIYRAPVINIGRNPYWGRNHEAWGEDPYLVGRMAVAYVRGLQGDDPRHLKIAATLKHFAVNNVEADRTKLNAVVPERALREYWLPHFRDAVVEGGAQSLMASYNAINGTPNNINRWLLTDLLKDEWKHEGFVVSDLGGVKTMVQGHGGGKLAFEDAVAQSVMAGCDFSDKEYAAHIPAAVRAGKLSLERLDDAVRRVLCVRFRLGEFDPFESVSWSRIPTSVIGSDTHRALARRAAQASIVLLQNEGPLLPLDRTKLKRLAVIGPLADRIVMNNYNGQAGATVTALEGIRNRAGAGLEVVHARGCDVLAASAPVRTQIDREAGFSGGQSVKLDATAAGAFIEFQVPLSTTGVCEVVLTAKTFPSRGTFQCSIDGVPQGGPFDLYAPTGRYAHAVSLGTLTSAKAGTRRVRFTAVGRSAASTAFSGHFDALQFQGAQPARFECESLASTTGGGDAGPLLAAAVAAARAADVAVVCVGTDARIEQEGRDRASLGLPTVQEELVQAVRAANPRTVVVEMSAGPLTVPWIKEHVPALLQAWWSGEEGGHALADVLFGDVNPAGRLPHTVYASEAQVPRQDEYDIRQGFTYMYVKGEPLFPFGHGLSYTTFRYGALVANGGATLLSPRHGAANSAPPNRLEFQVELQNVGPRAGDEVVQLYVTGPGADQPVRGLRGFQRVTLQPGEQRQLSFSLRPDQLARWDEAQHAFVTVPGRYEVQVGASSSDLRARAVVDVR
jgi:beta-glucosidase